jgi:hypothetical protein
LASPDRSDRTGFREDEDVQRAEVAAKQTIWFVVLSEDKISAIIDTLIAAVRNGELDEHLAQGSKVGMVKKRKAA